MYKILPILLFAYGLALTTNDIYDNSYALIIGIDKYENVSNLDYAVKDANSVASLLKDNFNFPSENVKILLNDEATLINVKNSLEEISLSAKVNDRVLIYFAGHGETDDLPDGGEMGYLLPIDGKRDRLFSTSVPMDDLKRISSMSKSKHMLFLIDACYGGLAATGARGLSSTTPNYIDKITKDKSRQIITAGGRGEQVIEKSEWGHSAFTLNLIRALEDGKADLNDDGYITGDELGLFLKEKVTIDSGNMQTPQSRRFTTHEGEFVFIANKMEIQIVNKTEETFEDTMQRGIFIDYKKLAKEIGKQQLESQEIGTSKILWSINPLGMIMGGLSFIAREKYIRNNWTLMTRINHFSYQNGDFSNFINDDNRNMNIQGVGIGFASTKYFSSISTFKYSGFSSSFNFDMFYIDTKRTFLDNYENTNGEYWKKDQINSLALTFAGSVGVSYNIYGRFYIQPMLGIAYMYLIHIDKKIIESGFAPMPILNISYLH